MKRFLPFLIILLVLVAGVGVAATLWKRSTPVNSNSGSPFGSSTSSNNSPAETTAASSSKQNSTDASAGSTKPNVKVSSPVVLEEYGDYQCPPCGQLYPELKQIEKEYGNQVQIVFHHFPLAKIHKNAVAAAHAAEAARNQNKFWEMHDLLYRNQKDWAELADPRPVFESYAKQLSLNLDAFDRDLESNVIDQRISADIQRGSAHGVTGTPTVFLDSQLVNYPATNLDGLRKGINILLERKAGS
ncbi:MAG TPA: thioredoxin domain-containing protein [Pyrinomonadaceae bacterium]|jgi:protein-disulfide isomerase|nr:thioredoxin domain-containing protein [Pyrinomonadaceae bacterium]